MPIANETLPDGGRRATGGSRENLQAALDHFERDMILAALKAAHGNKAKAARALGLTERLMGIRVKKHGIDWRAFRPRYDGNQTALDLDLGSRQRDNPPTEESSAAE